MFQSMLANLESQRKELSSCFFTLLRTLLSARDKTKKETCQPLSIM